MRFFVKPKGNGYYTNIRAVARYGTTRKTVTTGISIKVTEIPYLCSDGVISDDCPTAFDEDGIPDIAMTQYAIDDWSEAAKRVINHLIDSKEFDTTPGAVLTKTIEEERKNAHIRDLIEAMEQQEKFTITERQNEVHI